MHDGSLHVGAVDFSDGIQDDLAKISNSLVSGGALPVAYVAVTLIAALSSAYLGIQVVRALGAKSDISWAVGAVAGSLALDVGGKYFQRGRTNGR